MDIFDFCSIIIIIIAVILAIEIFILFNISLIGQYMKTPDIEENENENEQKEEKQEVNNDK